MLDGTAKYESEHRNDVEELCVTRREGLSCGHAIQEWVVGNLHLLLPGIMQFNPNTAHKHCSTSCIPATRPQLYFEPLDSWAGRREEMEKRTERESKAKQAQLSS